MTDAGVRPVEHGEPPVVVSDVAEVQVAVHERLRDVVRRQLGQPPLHLGQAGAGGRHLVGVQQPQLGAAGQHLTERRQAALETAVGAPGRAQLRDVRHAVELDGGDRGGGRCGQPGGRVVLVGDTAQRLHQLPAPVRLVAQQRGDPAGEQPAQEVGDARLGTEVVARRLQEHRPAVGGDTDHRRQAPHLHRRRSARCAGGRDRRASRRPRRPPRRATARRTTPAGGAAAEPGRRRSRRPSRRRPAPAAGPSPEPAAARTGSGRSPGRPRGRATSRAPRPHAARRPPRAAQGPAGSRRGRRPPTRSRRPGRRQRGRRRPAPATGGNARRRSPARSSRTSRTPHP